MDPLTTTFEMGDCIIQPVGDLLAQNASSPGPPPAVLNTVGPEVTLAQAIFAPPLPPRTEPVEVLQQEHSGSLPPPDTIVHPPVVDLGSLAAPLVGPLPLGDVNWDNNGSSSDDSSVEAQSRYSKRSQSSGRRVTTDASEIARSLHSFSGMSINSGRRSRRPPPQGFADIYQYEQWLHNGNGFSLPTSVMASESTTQTSLQATTSPHIFAHRPVSLSGKSDRQLSESTLLHRASPKVASRKAL
ncbi:unnamed protein product [Calypogeia fissa]